MTIFETIFESIPQDLWIHITYILVFVLMAILLTKESNAKWKALKQLSAKDSTLLLSVMALEAGKSLIDDLQLKLKDKEQELIECESDYDELEKKEKQVLESSNKKLQRLLETAEGRGKNERVQLKHEIEGLKKSMRLAESALVDKKNIINEQREHIGALEEKYKERGAEIRGLKSWNKRYKKQIADLSPDKK